MNLRTNTDGNLSMYELTLLQVLARQFLNVDAAMAEIARLSAVLTLPKGTVHVISDIHGEDKKLRHVINNASGTLRPVVERLFKERMSSRRVFGVSHADFLSGRGDPAAGRDSDAPGRFARVRHPHAAASV